MLDNWSSTAHNTFDDIIVQELRKVMKHDFNQNRKWLLKINEGKFRN